MISVGSETASQKCIHLYICYRASHSTAMVLYASFVKNAIISIGATNFEKERKRKRKREKEHEKQCAIQTYIGFCHGKIRFNLMERNEKIRNKIKHSKLNKQ